MWKELFETMVFILNDLDTFFDTIKVQQEREGKEKRFKKRTTRILRKSQKQKTKGNTHPCQPHFHATFTAVCSEINAHFLSTTFSCTFTAVFSPQNFSRNNIIVSQRENKHAYKTKKNTKQKQGKKQINKQTKKKNNKTNKQKQ